MGKLAEGWRSCNWEAGGLKEEQRFIDVVNGGIKLVGERKRTRRIRGLDGGS